MSGQGKVVCVSGASGYIASWLVKLLLQHGYTVKATVRNPSRFSISTFSLFFTFFFLFSYWFCFYVCIYATDDLTKTGHLLALDGAKEKLHLFKADLVEEGSFDSVIEGCDGVFHTASPVAVEVSDPQVHPTILLPFQSCRFSIFQAAWFCYIHLINFYFHFFFVYISGRINRPCIERNN